MTEDPILIVMRLADMVRVHPDQVTMRCSQCHHEVGVYPSGQAVIKQRPNTTLICQACRDPGPDAVLAPGAVTEPFESVRNTDKTKQ